MLAEFRDRYPKGSLISELISIDHGQYIVRVVVEVEGITLATSLSSSNNLEEAEDRALKRALSLLGHNITSFSLPEEKPKSVKNPLVTTTTAESTGKSTKLPNNGVTKPPLQTVNNQNLEEVSSPISCPPPSVEISSSSTITPFEMINSIDLELKRLGWKIEQGREYILTTYGKKSRHTLTNDELSDFLQHLQSQPTPSDQED